MYLIWLSTFILSQICIWTQPCRDVLYLVYTMIFLCTVCTASLYILYVYIYIYIYSTSLRFDLSKVHLMFEYRMLFLYIVQYNCTRCIVVQYHCHFLTQCNIITQMW